MGQISQYGDVVGPKLSDKLIGTSVGFSEDGELKDPTYNFTLQQLLSLFLPNIPSNTLQGVLDYGNTATQDINLFGTINVTNLNVNDIANLKISHFVEEAYFDGLLFDYFESSGNIGQVLSNTGSGIKWITPTIFTPTLQQVLEEGNVSDIDILLDANITANNINSKTIIVEDDIYLGGKFFDSENSSGTNGQVLISLGNSVEWQDFTVYTALSPIFINPATKIISIQQANGLQDGYLSRIDWINFDGKQNQIVVTTNGNLGPSTLIGNILNIPQYASEGLMGLTVTSPLVITSGDTPNISIPKATNSISGYLSSTDFNTFNSKENGITAGTTLQYFRGDKTFQTLDTSVVPELTNLYYTEARVNANTNVAANTAARHNAVTLGTANGLSLSTQVLSLALASSGVTGALSASDWATFSAKQNAITLTVTGNSGAATLIGSALNIPTYTLAGLGGQPQLNGTGFVKASGTTISYDNSTYLTTISGIAAGGELSGTYPNPTLVNSAVIGKVLTGLNLTGGGTIASTDSILQAFGKVQNQILGLVGGVIFQGTWNANTNSPALTSSVGTKGYYYIVDVAGSTNLNGITDWKIGDWAIFNGSTWDKVDNTDSVSSVNGFTGSVSLTTANISEVTNLYFTNARAIASLLTGYSSGSGTITSSDTILSAIQKLNGNIGALTTGVSSVNGLTGAVTLTTTNIAEGTNLYYTEARVNANTNVASNTAQRHTAVTLGAANGLSLSTQALSLGLASAGVTGALSGTDWNTFNSKENVLTFSTGLSRTGNTVINTITQYTDALARASLSFVAGSGAYNNTTGVITIPTNNNQITNGASFITLASLSGSAPIEYNNTTGAISITQAGTASNGYLSSTDWNTFNNKTSNVGTVIGTGTTNYLPKFTSGSAIGNSTLQEVSGNLGLGVTPSASTLPTIESQFGLFNGTSEINVTQNVTYDSVFRYTNNGAATKYYSGGGNHIWFTASSGTAGNAINFAQAMSLGTNGGLSIGTTTAAPANGLLVQGAGIFSSNVTATLFNARESNSASSTRILITNTSTASNTTKTSELAFLLTDTVGTIKDSAYIRAIPDDVNIIFASLGFYTRTLDANPTPKVLITYAGNVGIGTTSPSQKLEVAGNVLATAFFASSDMRLKELVKDNLIVKGIENISAKSYIKNGKLEVGYYAQDVQKILSSAVIRGADDMLSLSYQEVHTAKISSLEARVKELEAKLNIN